MIKSSTSFRRQALLLPRPSNGSSVINSPPHYASAQQSSGQSDHSPTSKLNQADPGFHGHTRSSVVKKVLLLAHEEGKSFSVYAVDLRPMLEGSVWYFP